jgi:hypothetical protein
MTKRRDRVPIPVENDPLSADLSVIMKNRIKQENIVVSIYGYSTKPQYWINFYDNIRGSNSTPFEIVFCGDAEFNFTLPDNFMYIYSKVKPVQCVEIARRACWGNLVFLVNDGCVFNKHCIDSMVSTYLENSSNKYNMVSTQYFQSFLTNDINERLLRLKDMSYYYINLLVKAETIEDMGGLDTRFISSVYDHDLAMRMSLMGGSLYYSPYSHIIQEYDREESLNKYKEYWEVDTSTIFSLWDQKTRIVPLETFKNKEILEKSQGSSGRWI